MRQAWQIKNHKFKYKINYIMKVLPETRNRIIFPMELPSESGIVRLIQSPDTLNYFPKFRNSDEICPTT